MQAENLITILVYYTSDKNKVIGKLKNISIQESLKEIRTKIKKMNPNDEFVKPKNKGNYDIFDKAMEEDFSLEDILIKENGIYKINIKQSSNNILINDNNNNLEKDQPLGQQFNNILENNLNNMNQMIINPLLNNMNNINNIVNMNNMVSMNNLNNMNNINNNMMCQDYNNLNNLNNNYNNQMNNNFIIKYDILFQTNNGIKYSLSSNGRTKMKRILELYEGKIFHHYYHSVQYFYYKQEILDKEILLSISEFFKNDKKPIIIVKDEDNSIGKLINVTFKISNGDQYLVIFNSKSNINKLKEIIWMN